MIKHYFFYHINSPLLKYNFIQNYSEIVISLP